MLYLLFKTREEPHNLLTIQRLCSVLDTRLHYLSYDGEAIMWAYDRLKNSPAKHRLLFVVTDGDISGTYINKKNNALRNTSANYFRDVVALIEAEKIVDIIGVPIKADVDEIFRRLVRIDSIEDIYKKLSPYVLKMLREFNSDEGEAAKARRLKMVAHRKARVAGQRIT
jgi:cobaltochelatase CobT